MINMKLALNREAELESWMMQHQERSTAQAVIESAAQEKISYPLELGKDLDHEIRLNVLLYIGKDNESISFYSFIF